MAFSQPAVGGPPFRRPAPGLRILLLGILVLAGHAGCWPAPLATPEGALRWSLLAVGDMGSPPEKDPEGIRLAVGEGMARVHGTRPADTLVLLGDNFYPNGLEAHELVARVRENVVRPLCAFARLDGPRSEEVAGACGLAAAERLPVPIRVVFGNHDDEAEGSRRRQRTEVPRFVPNWSVAEGRSEVVETGRGVSLVLLDSEWLWNEPGTRMAALRDALGATRGPWRIVLAHHPPLELQEEHEHEVAWNARAVRGALAAIADAGVPVHAWLAGHEHSLQLVPGRPGEPALIAIAGSGSEPRGPDVRPGTRFASEAPGFARVDLISRPDGDRIAVTLYEVEGDGPQARARAWVDLAGAITWGEDG